MTISTHQLQPQILYCGYVVNKHMTNASTAGKMCFFFYSWLLSIWMHEWNAIRCVYMYESSSTNRMQMLVSFIEKVMLNQSLHNFTCSDFSFLCASSSRLEISSNSLLVSACFPSARILPWRSDFISSSSASSRCYRTTRLINRDVTDVC